MSDHEQKRNWFARHKVLTVILGIVGIIVIASATGGSKDNAKDTSDKNDNKQAASSVAKLNEAARDGKFEFIITGVKCGETTVGTSEYLQKKAQGQFCRVTMSIKNIGDKAQSMFADNQKLIDSEGKEYSYDSSATIYAAPSGASSWFNEINPGNTVTGDILFDIPAGTTPASAMLHDSAFSSGVKVNLQ